MPAENTMVTAVRDTPLEQSTLEARQSGGTDVMAVPFKDDLETNRTDDDGGLVQEQPNEDSKGDLKVTHSEVEQVEEDEDGNVIKKEEDDALGAFEKALNKSNETLKQSHLSQEDKDKLAAEASKKAEGNNQISVEGADKGVDKSSVDYKAKTLREYGLDEVASTTLAKKMSTPAFEFAVSKLKEARELKAEVEKRDKKLSEITTGKLPDNYLEHPEAYVLDPRFGQAQKVMQDQTDLKNFYVDQYAKCRAGEDWEDLRQSADGKGIVTVAMKSGPRAEAYIAERMATANNIMSQAQGQVQAIVHQHKTQYAGLTNKIREQEDKYFPAFKDPAAMAKNPHIMAALKGFNDMGLLNNPITGFTAKLYAHAMDLSARLEAANKQLGTKQTVAQNQRKAGPTSATIQSGARVNKSNGSEEDVGDALEQMMKLTGKVSMVRK